MIARHGRGVLMLIKDNVTIGIEWKLGPERPRQRCGARTRKGTACQRAGSSKNGRCHLHGGASTGPRTAEGRARISAAQFKHGHRSKKAIAERKAATRKKSEIFTELKALESECIQSGLLPKDWKRAFNFS